MTTLILVESLGKTTKIRSTLGSAYSVVVSVGHVRDLPPGDDIDVEAPDFKPKYEATPGGRDVFKPLRGVVAAADAVLPATDPDREGEAIAWHLANALELRMPRHSLRTGRPECRPSIGSANGGNIATVVSGIRVPAHRTLWSRRRRL